jgi:hypothetical protein
MKNIKKPNKQEFFVLSDKKNDIDLLGTSFLSVG